MPTLIPAISSGVEITKSAIGNLDARVRVFDGFQFAAKRLKLSPSSGRFVLSKTPSTFINVWDAGRFLTADFPEGHALLTVTLPDEKRLDVLRQLLAELRALGVAENLWK